MSRKGALIAGLLCSWTIASGTPSNAYELLTHAAMTGQAFDRSAGVASYLSGVGIRADDTFLVEPPADREELGGFLNTGTVHDWMVEGAIREDDFAHNIPAEALGCLPPQNPSSKINRPLNHFFDVQRGGRGLTVLEDTVGLPAVDWALGRQGRGPNQDQNQFSLPDARDYQLGSLTAVTRESRERNTARMFRALGQVLHILEDMAQPQHTRNDRHAGCVGFFGGEHSWYEDYIDKRATGRPFRGRGPAPTLALDGYPPVQLASYQDFFTGPQGMADFSSRNFFSAGTNLPDLANLLPFNRCGGLTQPICEPAAYAPEEIDWAVTTLAGLTLTGKIKFYTLDIVDPL